MTLAEASAATRAVVIVDEAPLTAADVVAIARGARVSLGPHARARIAASRAVVDRLVSGEALIYGLNTGLGHMRNERLDMAQLEENQLVVIRGHAGAIGPPLAPEIVRAAMTVRLAGIARGGSGASPEMAAAYVGLLNAGVTPIVPEVGSVGASDLGHMAAIALVMIGEGMAHYEGTVLPGGEALARAGVERLRPAAKDGLTAISANGVSIGRAALVVDRAARLAEAADAVVALSLEAWRGNLSILDPVAAEAKPVAGQALAAARIRALLEGSALCVSSPSVQDPLSFRVVPQVHGAFRETLASATAAVNGELAAMDDNPLVAVEDGRMISNGNFHPMLMALAIDALRPAIAHVAQIADRRSGHLWDGLVSDPAVLSAEGVARLDVAPLVRYSIASRTAELRSLAHPASLDVGQLDLGVEDHATNAPTVVHRTDEALDALADVLAGELLIAVSSMVWSAPDPSLLAPRTRWIFELVRGVSTGVAAGDAAAVHGAVRALLTEPLAAPLQVFGAAEPAPPGGPALDPSRPSGGAVRP